MQMARCVECSQREPEDSALVVGLNLMDNGLDGTLPSDLALLSASLSSSCSIRLYSKSHAGPALVNMDPARVE
jgi:hypothetical protein